MPEYCKLLLDDRIGFIADHLEEQGIFLDKRQINTNIRVFNDLIRKVMSIPGLDRKIPDFVTMLAEDNDQDISDFLTETHETLPAQLPLFEIFEKNCN